MQILGKRQFRSQCLKQTLVLATPLEMKNTHAIEKNMFGNVFYALMI